MTVREAMSSENRKVFIEGTPFPTIPSLTGEHICRGYQRALIYDSHTGKEKRVHMILVMKDPHGLASSGCWIDIEKAKLMQET